MDHLGLACFEIFLSVLVFYRKDIKTKANLKKQLVNYCLQIGMGIHVYSAWETAYSQWDGDQTSTTS